MPMLLSWREDPDRALAAIANMEGEGWLKGEERNPDSDNGFRSCVAQMNRVIDWSTCVYGACGVNRYYLRPDGKVEFSKFHNNNSEVQAKRQSLHP